MNRRALAGGVLALLLGASSSAAPVEVCRNGTGTHRGLFYTFWKSAGDACMTLAERGRYTSRYRLGRGENLVVGVGWRKGSSRRTLGYRAAAFEAGANSYLALYGWSTGPLIEYYVVDSWGSAFKPPGPDARALGMVATDGGTYDIYRTRRVRQPSIRGTATFDQYWSVRRSRRPTGGDATITFANHVKAWRALGMALGRMNYQVMATEGFGSTGSSDVTVWRE
ncbi:MAG TPA: glycoside hydrolase family 11 protein [Croceibacterium sp.]|nr:glycoside hydrolase family 11 protein [Croceibacterium sp.]